MATSSQVYVLRYEAWPTRMFGAYTIWAIYSDETRQQVGHGTPFYCIDEVARRNSLLVHSPEPRSASS